MCPEFVVEISDGVWAEGGVRNFEVQCAAGTITSGSGCRYGKDGALCYSYMACDSEALLAYANSQNLCERGECLTDRFRAYCMGELRRNVSTEYGRLTNSFYVTVINVVISEGGI
jgi:hypothetical protein